MANFKTGLLAAAALALSTGALSAETFMRNGSEKVEVAEKDGKLYCTRLSDQYEMCNGMTKNADGSWGGKKMKHPDMPGFMSFNGTVTFTDGGLTIKGCTLGMCDSENWTKG